MSIRPSLALGRLMTDGYGELDQGACRQNSSRAEARVDTRRGGLRTSTARLKGTQTWDTDWGSGEPLPIDAA